MLTSRKPGKPPRELGAAWMHETAHNKLVPLISKLGITYYYDDGTPLYYTPWGPATSQFKAKKVSDEWADHVQWFYTENPDAPDRPAQESIRDYVSNHPLLTKDEKIWAPQALREVEMWIALNTDLASSKHLSYYIEERNLYVTGGYDTVTNYYAKPLLRDGNIQMGVEVTNIDHSDPAKVKVDANVNGVETTYEADAVIMTAPLGVLKRKLINFTPDMPPQYYKALDKYSFAALGKLFFEFEEVFWPKDNDFIVYYPLPPDKLSKEHPVLNNAFIINNLYVVAGGIKELCIQTSDPLTRELEAMTHEEVYAFFKPLFTVIQVEQWRDLPPLVTMEVTQWTKDKYAGYGTYSALQTGDDPDLWFDFLTDTESSRVQFAGEHCSKIGNGCVHGAFGTGEVSAKNLLNLFGVAYDGDNSPMASPA